MKLVNPIVAIIPVYNASKELGRLIDSLSNAIPAPITGLTFIFIDDHSTERGISELFLNDFFRREDVISRKNSINKGFVKTVNEALSSIPPGSDAVILNSDTRIFGEIFSVLQSDAYAEANIASVTPLANNGSIASLFNWPQGGHMPTGIAPELIADAARDLSLSNFASRSAPTGVGFCMFMRQDALKSVGFFDEKFGRGYGEECDWCQRAIKKGYKHIISANAFVFHAGSSSFLDEQKVLNKKNQMILWRKHPRYFFSVRRYLKKNPLQITRITLMLYVLKKYLQPKSIFLFALHSDPHRKVFGPVGGTERHVNFLSQMLDDQGHAVLEIFPKDPFCFNLVGSYRGEKIIDESFEIRHLTAMINICGTAVDHLHVHHLIGWSDDALQALLSFECKNKIFSAHDYWLCCRSYNLLKRPLLCCHVEEDKAKCENCYRQFRNEKKETIDLYRIKNAALLKRFDKIIFPSLSLYPYFKKALAADWSEIERKVKILPHDLSHLLKDADAAKPNELKPCGNNLIVFIGAIGYQKGANIIIEAIPMLQKQGFAVKIFGHLYSSQRKNLRDIEIVPYRDFTQLKVLFEVYKPGIFIISSIWPETFSYAFYEGLLLGELAIPVVSPQGNPADVAAREQIGVTMSALGADAMVEACVFARDNHELLLKKKNDFIARIAAENSPYYDRYIDLFANSPHRETPVLAEVGAMAACLCGSENFFDVLKDHIRSLKILAYRSLSSQPAIIAAYKDLECRWPILKRVLVWISR